MNLVIIIGLPILQWFYLLAQINNYQRWKINIIRIFIGGTTTSALIPFCYQAISLIGAIAIFIFNFLLAILVCRLIKKRLELGESAFEAVWYY